ncbi:cyclic nucleotide-binding domain-containing protein [Marinibaculum pumilum]|uniref:Cyclic nucleotide-binding domain-containing protein n=1 Tax=Marinibaculum pumilum TaxID=1766165 RepID=A0ABV7KY72_9PROT
MSLHEEVELLRNIPMFAKIEPSKLKLLAFTSERLTFRDGEVLFRQGDPGDAAYIIVNGRADVIVDTPNGPLRVAELKKNDFVGEIAILCDVPRTATIAAASELVTLKISKDLFFRLVTEFPQMAVEIMRVLAQRLEKTTTDLREATAKLNAQSD